MTFTTFKDVESTTSTKGKRELYTSRMARRHSAILNPASEVRYTYMYL